MTCTHSYRSRLSFFLHLVLVTHTSTDHPRWTIEECAVPTGPDHPVTPYSPAILSLTRMAWISDAFWLQYTWSAQPQDACGLQRNVLYFVRRKQSVEDRSTQFTFTAYPSYREWLDNGAEDKVCYGTVVVLGKGSYGFVSCQKDYLKATKAARSWQAGVPHSFFLILLGVVAGLALLISATGLIACVVSKKKLTGFFSLHDHRLDTNLAPPPTTLEPPNT